MSCFTMIWAGEWLVMHSTGGVVPRSHGVCVLRCLLGLKNTGHAHLQVQNVMSGKSCCDEPGLRQGTADSLPPPSSANLALQAQTGSRISSGDGAVDCRRRHSSSSCRRGGRRRRRPSRSQSRSKRSQSRSQSKLQPDSNSHS